MPKKFPNWSQDLGLKTAIAPHTPKIDPADYGLKGALAEGRLSFSRLNTRAKAKEDAAAGLPPSDAATPDQWSEREQLIAAEAEDVRRGVASWFSANAASVKNFILDATPADLSTEQLKEAIKTGEADLRHFELDDASEAENTHEAAKRELTDFQSRHKEQIGERTPDIQQTIEQAIAVLMGLLIVEGAFNALLFKDAQAGGLLGGLLVAFGVSAVNVTLGVCAGFFGLRYAMNHPKTPLKVMGGVIAGMFVLAGLFLNLFVAHYRDSVEIAMTSAEAAGTLGAFSMFDVAPGTVIGSMFPNPFGLGNMVAFGLLFAGLAIFAMAVYEGYDRISDKYPGYGRVWRKERRAYEQRQSVRNGLRDDLAHYFSACRTWFEVQHGRHIDAKREIEKSINTLEALRTEAMTTASRCADQERGLKIAYRQAHRKARLALRDTLGDEAAPPLYFDEIVTPDLPSLDTSAERELASDAGLTIGSNLETIAEARRWLESYVQTVQEGLSSIEKMSRAPSKDSTVQERREAAKAEQKRRAA